MDLPLHSGVKLAVSWVDSSKWKQSKAINDASISRHGFGLHIFGCTRYFVHRLPWKYQILYRIIDAFERKKLQKMVKNKEISALSPRQCTVLQVSHNNIKTKWIALWITSISTLFSRSGPQRLLAVCKPQKYAPEKEIWLQWRTDIRNWGVFRGQRQILQQKRDQIVREALEPVYHPRRRLLMNKVEFCLKVVVLLVRPRTYWVM